jgi:methylphosphotriester-DNA--protein-cysteine methyltransferase
MLASVMYNLDRRVVPVYCSGCMCVLFLYIQPLQYTGIKRISRLYITEASIHTRYKNKTNIQPLQYTGTKRLSRLYITEASIHTRYRVCMLASVMCNLDRRVVPVYYCGCMFGLFLYRVCMLASVMYREASIHTRYKNRTNIQPLQYTGTIRLSRLYITEASIHTRYKNRTHIQPLQYTATKRLSVVYQYIVVVVCLFCFCTECVC